MQPRKEIRNGPSFDRDTKLKARTLYLVKGRAPSEIAEKLKITKEQVYNLANKYGWAKQRREAESKALAQVEDKVAAQIADDLAVAVQADEGRELGFELVRNAAAAGDCKGFALAAKGTQILDTMVRVASGRSVTGLGNGPHSLTMICGRFGDQGAREVAAEPIEVQTQNVSDSMILEFDQSQQAESSSAESVELISARAQTVGKAS